MTNFFWFSDVLLAAVVMMSFALPAVFAALRGQLKNWLMLSEEFFECANKLVEDEETPELIVSYLETMARIMNEAEFSRKILGYSLTGRLRDTTNQPTARSTEFMSAVHGMRSELQGFMARASVACLMSATYKSLVFGVVVRRMILFSIEKDQKQAEIVAGNLFSNGFGNWQVHA